MAFHAYRMMRSWMAICSLALLGVSCSGLQVSPTKVVEKEIPLELHWVMNSAEYRALCVQTYALAETNLERWVEGRERGSWAVSLDADETVLSNTGYQEWLVESGETYSTGNWEAWVLLEEANAVPGAKAFLERIHELGGTIAIVTNRREPICDATESNLQALGLPYDLILCKQGESSKEGRWQKIVEGKARPDTGPLEILMWFGDNIHDFPKWSQSRRGEDVASFGEFGSHFFVLPNPLYGSWESNTRSE